MNTHDKYELPPNPITPMLAALIDKASGAGTSEVIWQLMQEFANQAIEADRKRRGEPIYQECINDAGLWQDTFKQTYDDIVAGRLDSIGVRVLYTAPVAQDLEDADREVLAEHSGCGRGTQVEQVTVKLNPGDKVVMVKGRITMAIDAARAAKEQP